MNQTIEWKKTQPGSTEAVQFSDGMLVTAEDLTAAMRYPLSVIQVLLKAYFGCGIVCGLRLTDPAAGQQETAKEESDPATGETRTTTQAKPVRNFILTVEKGVALGCDGYPIEICGPLKLDLTPDPCRSDRLSKTMLIAARRVTAAEAAARPCGCSSTGGEPAQQCTRMRDHALVRAFYEESPPAELCRAAAKKAADGKPVALPAGGEPPTGATALCDCLTECGECACCGEPWVLLGTVDVGEDGLGKIDMSGRKLVKPIACHCAAGEPARTPPPPPPTPGEGDTVVTKAPRRKPADTPGAEEKPTSV